MLCGKRGRGQMSLTGPVQAPRPTAAASGRSLMSSVKHRTHDRDVLRARQREVD
jgi:hypothetical protein